MSYETYEAFQKLKKCMTSYETYEAFKILTLQRL